MLCNTERWGGVSAERLSAFQRGLQAGGGKRLGSNQKGHKSSTMSYLDAVVIQSARGFRRTEQSNCGCSLAGPMHHTARGGRDDLRAEER